MQRLAAPVIAVSFSLMAGVCLGENVAGYDIFRHQQDGKCSASLFFDTVEGRQANISYFVYDDGQMDEVFFGLRPTATFDPAELLVDQVTVVVDGNTVWSGPGGPDPSGLIKLPNLFDAQRRELLQAIDSGGELELALRDRGQRLEIDLSDLRTARAALAKCVEEKNANP